MVIPTFFITKYKKPKRIPVPGLKYKGRPDRVMSLKDAEFLLSGEVVIEEKMDGSTVSFFTDRFIIWAEDMRIRHTIKYRVPGRFFVFDVYDVQTGHFLPRDDKLEVVEQIRRGKILVYLFFRGEKRFKIVRTDPMMFVPVAEVARGVFKITDLYGLIGKSAYAYEEENGVVRPAYMEGIVVKQNRPLFIMELSYSYGKVVREEFTQGIQEHYRKRRMPEYNIIDPSIPIVIKYQKDTSSETSDVRTDTNVQLSN